MPKSPFEILVDHLDHCCDGCYPWRPVCADGVALMRNAVKAASMIAGLDAEALTPDAKA